MALVYLRRELRRQANPNRAALLQRFFKTGPGEYGEGDRFLGLTVPQVRTLVKRYRQLSLQDTKQLLRSPVHEERLLALLLLVQAYRDGDANEQQGTYELYLRSTKFINNWDLVDCSAEHIVGAFLCRRCSGGSVNRRPCRKSGKRPALATLTALARSKSLWERRIAVLATFHFIKHGEFAPPLRIARLLLRDEHDLIQKAIGWMLREVGKRDSPAEEAFLRRHYRQMPRTMLRYAIERFPEHRRLAYLHGTICAAPLATPGNDSGGWSVGDRSRQPEGKQDGAANHVCVSGRARSFSAACSAVRSRWASANIS